MLLRATERRAVLEKVVEAVGAKCQVIAHTGAFDTATTLELTEHAREAGAAAAGVVAPGYYGYDEAALEQYYRTIAKAVPDFPILLYNIPGCAKNDLSPQLVMKLAQVDNIVGIKDSTGSMGGLTWLLGNAPKGFHVINGDDSYGFQAFVAGSPAAVSGTSNVVCDLYAGIYKMVKQGQLDKAWRAQVKLNEGCHVFKYGSMAAIFKEGMRLRGFDPGYVRPPQRELTAVEKKNLAKRMEAAGLL
jgi:dihydrodipicolinate synthase/N-acetylneuraminate lyase